jgi:cytochrome o ubiquinol oxidase subunit 2
MDWKWLFIYPAEGVAMVNRLVITADRPVHLSLTSATVMQSILMPRLAGQIYAMPGMRTQLNFAASAPGAFRGENTQFNGVGFQNQTFEVASLNARDFGRWLAETKAQPNRLDAAAYEILSRRSTLPHPLAFGAVDPDLFSRVLAPKPMPPGPLRMDTTPP